MEGERHTVRDVEFELTVLTPGQAQAQHGDAVRALPTSPNTSVYAVAKCETAKGPFVCVMPLDGRLALFERNLAEKLVSAAYDELARKWTEEGYHRT